MAQANKNMDLINKQLILSVYKKSNKQYKIAPQSRERLSELDQAGIFQADDEVGYFFKNLMEIQRDLDMFVK